MNQYIRKSIDNKNVKEGINTNKKKKLHRPWTETL